MTDVSAAYTDKYRTSWLMTLEDDLGTVQSPMDVYNATNITVQCIPLPFISGFVVPPGAAAAAAASPVTSTASAPLDTSDLANIYKQWGGYAFRVRQGDYSSTEGFAVSPGTKRSARFSKPQPVVPMSPSATLNARVTLPPGVPPLPPGMLNIK